MTNIHQRQIMFVPGKNPKPPPDQHHDLLWRTLLEGVRRAEPGVFGDMKRHSEDFKLIAWNHLYYHKSKDISRDLPWVDALIHQHSPTAQDIQEANAWHRKLNRILYSVVDRFPVLLRLMPKPLRSTAEEVKSYFVNEGNVGCKIRDLLKQQFATGFE